MIRMMILGLGCAGMTHPEFRRHVTEVHEPPVKSATAVPEATAKQDGLHGSCRTPSGVERRRHKGEFR